MIRHRDNAEENLSNAKSLNREKINDLCFNTTTRQRLAQDTLKKKTKFYSDSCNGRLLAWPF